MRGAMRGLLPKLLLVNILIIGFVITFVWFSVDYLAEGYFDALMAKYHISPTESHEMFVESVHTYLIWASLADVLLAVALSFFLLRRLLRPLTQMTHISQRIASGDYSGKVPIRSRDEIGRLAEAFNRMAESLHAIEQLRKTMMVDVAHELRTPLTNVKGYLEALTEGVVPASRETFELLQEETERLVQLAEDVLRLAKADAARADLHKVNTELVGLIAQTLATFRPRFNAKDICVQTDLPTDQHVVSIDPDKLTQVVANLLQNAVQYTPPGGTVRIRVEYEPAEVTAIFSNPAGDLAEEDLPFIFERFYRGDKSRSRQHGGAGIGLAIVKELVEAHNGTVGAKLANNDLHVWFSIPR